uniref:hypothetical protein n=1 Tax=Pectobacterium carotovorum TaxID=554 RepID=UPI0015E80B3B|nr:hypothetical protein [Pectobacterium carotovorum]
MTATIVASSCVGEIITATAQGRTAGAPGTVDFGVVNPKARSVPAQPFSLRLSEFMGGETGCSAFEAYGRQYPVATLSFGDIGHTQLDENGVILRYDDGSDARLRVRISPTNVEGTFVQTGSPGYITSAYTEVAYPIAFATKGQFDFQAVLSQWDRVKPGRFSGSLTVTVVYR